MGNEPRVTRRGMLTMTAAGTMLSATGMHPIFAQSSRKAQRIELDDRTGYVALVEAVLSEAMKTENKAALELAQIRMIELAFHVLEDKWSTRFSAPLFIARFTKAYNKDGAFVTVESGKSMNSVAIDNESRRIKVRRISHSDLARKTKSYVDCVSAIVMINELAFHILRDFSRNDASVLASAIKR